MKIAIEAQRIFRPNKHGMDFVALETIRELQKIDKENEYFIFVSPGPDHCLNDGRDRQCTYHRSEMPDLSTLGTMGVATCDKEMQTGFASLHKQYCTFAYSGSSDPDSS